MFVTVMKKEANSQIIQTLSKGGKCKEMGFALELPEKNTGLITP